MKKLLYTAILFFFAQTLFAQNTSTPNAPANQASVNYDMLKSTGQHITPFLPFGNAYFIELVIASFNINPSGTAWLIIRM